MLRAAVLVAMLSGCAQPYVYPGALKPTDFRWLEYASRAELDDACRGTDRKARPAYGCFAIEDGRCVIRTLSIAAHRGASYHETIGHEARHCRDGLWHD